LHRWLFPLSRLVVIVKLLHFGQGDCHSRRASLVDFQESQCVSKIDVETKLVDFGFG
jgi:hypothetical protein